MAPSLLADARRGDREVPAVGLQQLDPLSRACGIRLRAYRDDHVAERVARAMVREEVRSPAALATLLRRCPDARARFRRSVAISVTGPLRDPEQFDLLRTTILPMLDRGGDLRIWSAGCATGHELRDVAALVTGGAWMLGSDLLEENVRTARAGAAPLGKSVRWEVRDLTQDGTPEGRFHLILCRNVGIYLAPDARKRLIDLLASVLAPGGVLMLGRSEVLVDPALHGLRPCADHAYRRPR